MAYHDTGNTACDRYPDVQLGEAFSVCPNCMAIHDAEFAERLALDGNYCTSCYTKIPADLSYDGLDHDEPSGVGEPSKGDPQAWEEGPALLSGPDPQSAVSGNDVSWPGPEDPTRNLVPEDAGDTSAHDPCPGSRTPSRPRGGDRRVPTTPKYWPNEVYLQGLVPKESMGEARRIRKVRMDFQSIEDREKEVSREQRREVRNSAVDAMLKMKKVSAEGSLPVAGRLEMSSACSQARRGSCRTSADLPDRSSASSGAVGVAASWLAAAECRAKRCARWVPAAWPMEMGRGTTASSFVVGEGSPLSHDARMNAREKTRELLSVQSSSEDEQYLPNASSSEGGPMTGTSPPAAASEVPPTSVLSKRRRIGRGGMDRHGCQASSSYARQDVADVRADAERLDGNHSLGVFEPEW